MTDQGLETGTPDRRPAVRFRHAAAALIVLTCGETFAAPKPTLNVAVAPSRVTAGATGNTLMFTFTATSAASGTAFVTIPTPPSGAPWSAPQTSNPTAAGYVSTNVGKCNSVGVPSVSGTWTVAVDWKCAPNKTFTLVYRTTAAARAGQYTFASQVTVGKQTLALAPQPVVTVAPGAAASLSVTGPASAVAGVAQSVTVTARDAFANVATGYTGTVQFTSTDPGTEVELPGTYAFLAGDNGVHAFTNDVTLTTVGSQNVTAVDTAQTSIRGSATITVTPGPAASLELSGIGNAVAGTAQSATVTALDDFGNVATGYDGTVHFASSDPKAVLPGYPPDPFGGQPVQDYTFTSADAGTHTFASGVVLKTALSPNSVVDVTDVDDPSLTSSQQPVISPGPAHTIIIGLPSNKANYQAWNGFFVSTLSFCGADAQDLYGNRTPTMLKWSSTDPAARLPATSTAPTPLTVCNFATVGQQTVTVEDASNSALKATDIVNVIGGPQANPDDVTLLDPAHVYGVTRWLINVLVNDDQVKLDVFNPFLDFYNTIYSVEQATYSDNGTLYQVGLMGVSGDLHFVAWDLDPPADVEPTVPGAQMLRCPAPDELGTVSSICHITGPITAGYTMTDGANYRSTELTLHLETPDGPVTPLSHTQTAAPITISTDASRRATISVEPGVNVPVMQTILLGPLPTTTTTTGLIATTTSTSTSTPTTSSTSTTLIPAGAVQVNLNFNNTLTSTDGINCAPGVNNCTVNIPTSASTALTAPTVGGLTIGGGNLVQGIVYAAQPQILRYNFLSACQVATNKLSDLYKTPANGGTCSVNSTCDTVVGKGDGVCTNGICTAGLVPPACSMNSDCDTAAGRNDGVCGATGRCTQGKVPTRCSNIPVVEGQVLPPSMVPVQMLLGNNPNNPAVQYSVLGIFNFITPLFDACKPDQLWKSYCQVPPYCTTGQDCGSGCCCDVTATCMEVNTCNTDPSATCK